MTSKTTFLAFVAALVCVPSAAMALASAELYSTEAYYYGRFEARVYFAAGDGVVSAFFLWKEGSEADNAYWNELDLEKFGADCSMQTNAFYGNPETQHQQKHSMSVNICAGYHDYRMEWTPTYIAWSVDGKEIRRDTGATATAFADNAKEGMTFHFNIWPGNSSFGGNINNTKLPVHQYISWVQYSSYENGSFKQQWREEFDATTLPSGWAVGDWSSPFNLSTHNAQNVAFVNGIAVMSLTADNATGNPGTPPVDPNASASGGSGGTTSSAGGSGGSGGTSSTGGTSSSGGTTSTGGTTASGGSSASGGRTSSGGTTASGGTTSTTSAGGMSPSGGTTRAGGTTSSGGMSGSGGASSTTSSGGTVGAGGDDSRSGGTPGSGGTSVSGGSSDPGGATASGGSSTTGTVEPTTNDGGCSCSTSRAASPLWPVLLVLSVVLLRRRRKEI